MSVNIGGDPAAGVPESLRVNSPGVLSLNSATESPRATPTPQSPMPMPKQQLQQPPPPAPISTISNSNSQLQNKISSSNSMRKVIQELKPVGNDTSTTVPATVNNQNKVKVRGDDVQQPTSPTKTYLTQFPVVKGGQQKKPDPKLSRFAFFFHFLLL